MQEEMPPYALGKHLGIKSAFAGSVIFAFLEIIGIFINTHLIQQIDTPDDIRNILFNVGWFIFVILLGCLLSCIPARFLGGILARWLYGDYGKQTLTKKVAFAKGGLVGVVAVTVICVPVLVFEYDFIQHTGHGDFLVFVFRTIEATIIATIAGGWSGLQIEKFLKQKPKSGAFV